MTIRSGSGLVLVLDRERHARKKPPPPPREINCSRLILICGSSINHPSSNLNKLLRFSKLCYVVLSKIFTHDLLITASCGRNSGGFTTDTCNFRTHTKVSSSGRKLSHASVRRSRVSRERFPLSLSKSLAKSVS